MGNKNEFEIYAKQLDIEIGKLPTLKEWEDYYERWPRPSDENEPKYFRGFVTTLKKILEILGAGEIEEYHWHEHIFPVRFKPVYSPYFRLGKFGILNNVPVTKNLEGIIAIGFDEGLDYPDEHKPELVVFYKNEDDDFYTDIDLYKPENWRDAINEFFEVERAHQLQLTDF